MGDTRKGNKVGRRVGSPKGKVKGTHITRALRDAFHSTAQAVVQMQEAMHLIKLMENSDDSVLGVAQRLKGHSKIIKNLDERIDSLERKARQTVILPVHPAYQGASTDVAAYCIPSANYCLPITRVANNQEIVASKPSSLGRSGSPSESRAKSKQLSPSISKTSCRPTCCSISSTLCQDPAGYSGNVTCMGKRLLKAAHEGRLQDVEKLLSAGADVNYSGTGMWTPLHRAAAKSRANVLELLIKSGSNINAKDCFGFTALHMAAYNDISARCVTYLVDAGADVRGADRSGRTPLHSAAEGANGPAVLALIEAGALKDVKDAQGRLPFDVAKDEGVRRLLYPYKS